jgi:hypothetical protein
MSETVGVAATMYEVGAPPVAAAVNGTETVVVLVTVTVPIVGPSGTSAMGVMPGITLLLFTLAKIVIFLYAYPN